MASLSANATVQILKCEWVYPVLKLKIDFFEKLEADNLLHHEKTSIFISLDYRILQSPELPLKTPIRLNYFTFLLDSLNRLVKSHLPSNDEVCDNETAAPWDSLFTVNQNWFSLVYAVSNNVVCLLEMGSQIYTWAIPHHKPVIDKILRKWRTPLLVWYLKYVFDAQASKVL